MFCKSRDSWGEMPGGLIQTVLCDEKIATLYERLDEIFYYLEKADKPCLVAIDEFQAIAKYPEKILKLYCVPIFSIAQMQDLFMQVPNGI